MAFAKMLTDIVFPSSFERTMLDGAGILHFPETMASLFVPCEIGSKRKPFFAFVAFNGSRMRLQMLTLFPLMRRSEGKE
jgi:hypothetical protein